MTDKKDGKPKNLTVRVPKSLADDIQKFTSASGLSQQVVKGLADIGVNMSSVNSSLPNLNLDSIQTYISSTEPAIRYFADRTSYEEEFYKTKKELEKATKKFYEITEKNESEKKDLKDKLKNMQELEKLSFYKKRIHPGAFERLRNDSGFRNMFFSGSNQATVLSVDIRKSTQLMLKAKTPKEFAAFTSSLAKKMQTIVIENHGVFDKFTGDGILAYFPDFYSGQDHVIKAIISALLIHAMFDTFYKENKHIFKTRPTDLGLGIGIDSGLVHLEEVAGEVYIIGDPVVYACRFSSAPAKTTWANPRIEDDLNENCIDDIKFSISEAAIKGEGMAEVLSITGLSKQLKMSKPEWINLIND